MQGYDSVAIDADVELGGTDQKFNNLVGRDMQKRFGKEPQIVVLMPLLEGTDGSEKMSKSLGNAIGISDDPKDIFGKAMSIPDTLIYKYFELGTRVPLERLNEIKCRLENPNTNPRDVKRELAFELVKLYYDEAAAVNARDEFDKIFIKKEIPDDIQEIHITDNDKKLIDIIFENNLAESKSNARRLIEQGAVSINGDKINDVNFTLSECGEFVIKAGKKKFLKVIIK